MNRRITLIAAIAMLGLTAAAQSQPRLELYDNSQFRSVSVTLTRDIPDLKAVNFNNRARSLIATGRWELCQFAHYGGNCRIYEGSHSEIPGFGNYFSSARFVGGGAQLPARNRDLSGSTPSRDTPDNLVRQEITLYDNTQFRGPSVTLTRDTPNLHIPELRFGDRARSLVATGRWELCPDINYRGNCRIYEGRHVDLPGLGNTFSSLRYLGPSRDVNMLRRRD